MNEVLGTTGVLILAGVVGVVTTWLILSLTWQLRAIREAYEWREAFMPAISVIFTVTVVPAAAGVFVWSMINPPAFVQIVEEVDRVFPVIGIALAATVWTMGLAYLLARSATRRS